ncbi:MAG: hypothetical protein HYX27_07940 [Acidobacteria bacterium]|nr:hypothetical protein [Acidobacteriota bacterium]
MIEYGLRRLAIVLSLVLLFFSIALFSPLHRHTRDGARSSCSFNDLEHQMVSTAEAAAVLAPLAYLIEAQVPVSPEQPAEGLVLSARGRAPPVVS